MNYTLNQLQVFAKVVETSSITKAAEELFITQPAASIQMRNFQDQFDIALTIAVGRNIKITDFGMEIYKMVEKILEEVYAINYKTQAYKGLLSGRLSLSVVSTGKYVMPYFLSEFMKLHQGIDLRMDVTNKSKVINDLIEGEFEFALVSILPEKLDVNEIILLDNELNFIANKNFNSGTNKLSKSDLETHTLIFREEGSATRKIMEDYFEKKNFYVRKKIELTSNEAVKQALLAGLGISIMPLIGIRNELKNKTLKILPSAGLPIKTKWRIIWLKGKKLSPVGNAFKDYILANKEILLKKYFNL